MGDCPFHGTCQSLIRECEQLRENDRAVMIEVGQMKERIVATEQSCRSAHHRLDSMEKNTDAVIRLAISVEGMTKKVEDMMVLYNQQNETIAEHDERLDVIERKPGEIALKSWQWLTLGLISGVGGILLTMISAITLGYLKVNGG